MTFRPDIPWREREPKPAEPKRPFVRVADPRCELTGRCRHPECIDIRAVEAKRLRDTTDLTLAEIGARFGGRDHTIIGDWLRRAA